MSGAGAVAVRDVQARSEVLASHEGRGLPMPPHGTPEPRAEAIAPAARCAIVLLGTGTVGRAVLQRLHAQRRTPGGTALQMHAVANTRVHWSAPVAHVDGPAAAPVDDTVEALVEAFALRPAVHAPGASAAQRLDAVVDALDPCRPRIVIDATASLVVARRHARWLARGIHVVTACKLARGTALRRWRSIEQASRDGAVRYGEAATVGAGLPVLSSLRQLRASGERIHGIAGVLSGSLAWLLQAFDGTQPFSALVARAQAAGYTEPDPRDDLSGADVRRKLLILARAAGVSLHEHAVSVESLVPIARSGGSEPGVDWTALDAPMRQRLADAHAQGRVLRYVARWDAAGARVGLDALNREDPLALGTACDNRVVIHCDRYRAQPLVIQGPGAGGDVTAAAVMDDVWSIARGLHAHASIAH